MNQQNEIGRNAAARALETAKHCAAVAGLAIVLSPLASLPAHAVIASPAIDVSYQVGSSNGHTTITYTFSNNDNLQQSGSGGGSGVCGYYYSCGLSGISLPEYHSGDLNFTGGLPSGWSFTDTAAPIYAGASVTAGTASAYVNLTYTGACRDDDSFCGPIYYDNSADFTAIIPTDTLIDANFGYQVGPLLLVTDPPIPDTRNAVNVPTDPNAVPEPSALASLGIGGLAALLAARRRRKS